MRLTFCLAPVCSRTIRHVISFRSACCLVVYLTVRCVVAQAKYSKTSCEFISAWGGCAFCIFLFGLFKFREVLI